MEYLGYLIIVVIALILIGYITYLVFSSQEERKVRESSTLLKKLIELNSCFPVIDIDYQHHIEDCVEYRTKKSVDTFNPQKSFRSHLEELQDLTRKRWQNLHDYHLYHELFTKTLEQSKTEDSTIQRTHLCKKRYLAIENKYVRRLFQRKKDEEPIVYSVYAHYLSKAGQSETTSKIYTFQECDFHTEFVPIERNIDYNPCHKDEVVNQVSENTNADKAIAEPISSEPAEEVPEGKKPDSSTDKVEEIKEKPLPIQEEKEEIKKLNPEIDNIRYSFEDQSCAVISCKDGITDIHIPSSVIYEGKCHPVVLIKQGAFKNNRSIKTLFIEEGVTEIQKEAFKGCTMLTYVSLPSTLKQIGDKAFSGCIRLQSVTLQEGLESLGEEVFSLCANLKDVYLPSTLIQVKRAILWYSCQTKIHIPEGIDTEKFDPEWNVDDSPIVYEAI